MDQVKKFWDDCLRYLYLPRLLNKDVLSQVSSRGVVSKNFFGIAHGYDGNQFEGFQFGIRRTTVQLDDCLLIIDSAKSADYDEKLQAEQAKKRAEVQNRLLVPSQAKNQITLRMGRCLSDLPFPYVVEMSWRTWPGKCALLVRWISLPLPVKYR